MKRINTKHILKWMIRGMYLYLILFILTILIMVLNSSCSVLGKKTPEKYINTAIKNSDKKEYLKAYKNYTKALELNPQMYSVYYDRAMIEIKLDSLEKAIDDMGMYIESLRTKTNEGDRKLLEKALIQRAEIMNKKGYKSDACSDYNDACELNISNKPCDLYRLNCK